MNPGIFGALPSSACTLGASGGENDRISKSVFDAIGRVTRSIAALSTTLQQDAVTTTYTLNGLVATVKDAKGNLTTYEYDGHDQLLKTRYPHPSTAGTSSATDFDLNIYNYASGFAGILTGSTRRDGQSFAYSYDNLGRMTSRNAPGSDPDVSYAYDNLNRLLTASQTGNTLTYAYDALGRRLSETGPLGTVSYQYDAGGRRTRVTWPDAFYVQYDYDVTGAMTNVRENGAASGVGVLATYAYDDLGRRKSIARGNGLSTSLAFDAASRLTSLAHDAAGTADDQTWGFSFNPASQIMTQTASNAAWNWSYGVDQSDAYTANGLNQTLTAGAASQTYDGRGNMTNDGLGRVMGYDSDNRLVSVSRTVNSVTTSSTLAYDPAGRLYSFAVTGGATTKFLYDGGEAIAEHDASNALLRRYVKGAGADETLVWYEGSGTADRRWLLTDPRGSVIATANSSGTVTAKNKYDDYGAPASGNVGRFQYTGQMWLAEAGLYHYKARAYHPELGRFLQTDPIGYGDGLNMYAYVGGDPVNATDPEGECASPASVAGGALAGALIGTASGIASEFVAAAAEGRQPTAENVQGAAAKGFVVGAIAGGVAGATCNPQAAKAAAAAAGVLIAQDALGAIAQGLVNRLNPIGNKSKNKNRTPRVTIRDIPTVDPGFSGSGSAAGPSGFGGGGGGVCTDCSVSIEDKN